MHGNASQIQVACLPLPCSWFCLNKHKQWTIRKKRTSTKRHTVFPRFKLRPLDARKGDGQSDKREAAVVSSRARTLSSIRRVAGARVSQRGRWSPGEPRERSGWSWDTTGRSKASRAKAESKAKPRSRRQGDADTVECNLVLNEDPVGFEKPTVSRQTWVSQR